VINGVLFPKGVERSETKQVDEGVQELEWQVMKKKEQAETRNRNMRKRVKENGDGEEKKIYEK
jgi:hypothetical protein